MRLKVAVFRCTGVDAPLRVPWNETGGGKKKETFKEMQSVGETFVLAIPNPGTRLDQGCFEFL